MRGKLSEGIDFPDKMSRGIFIVGIPFPPLNDIKVKTKKEVNLFIQYLSIVYNNEKNKKNAITGDQWYKSEAYRAVNQAIGRLIRHINDWGAVYFCD